ncbi:MAG: DUF6514 family protein [Lachnospiraceae bacterium]|nr:DUF6514 family protein [Lachnospiraceae bacterium]
MDKLMFIGSKEFETGNHKDFIVYYYIQFNEAEEAYGIRLEKKYYDNQKEFEYAEEKGITESRMVAEELANYLIHYDVTPVSLPETLDAYFEEQE